MKCVGIHAYGGSLSLALSAIGITPLVCLESEREQYRVAVRYFGDQKVILDETHKWADAFKQLMETKIDLLYGQPIWKANRKINNNPNAIDGKDVDDFLSAVKKLEPRMVLMAASKKAFSQVMTRLKRSFCHGDNWLYHWSTIRTNALLYGLPHDRDIMYVIGFKDFQDKIAFHNVLATKMPIPLLSKSDVPKLWKSIKDLSEVEPIDNGDIQSHTDNSGALVNNHMLPGVCKSILSRLLWESIPLLKEGENFDNIEERPKIYHEKKGYFLKGQLPVRLHRDLPASSIYGAERYIHPTLNRPMTLRELARLFGVPDNFDLGLYYGPGLTVLGRFVPVPVSKWIFGIIKETMRNGTSYETNDDFGLGIYDLFTERSRESFSELKRSHGKWVNKYRNKIFEPKPCDTKWNIV